jgi:hypothetical protein
MRSISTFFGWQSLIDVIDVDDAQIRIKGAKTCSNKLSWPAGMGPFRVRR